MGDVYNEQVGYQQPYQAVGKAGSQGLIDNQGYLTRQFGASDLNEQLAPNYAFQLQQGQMANQRAANMGGGSLGGNALRGLQDYTQNYAAGAYQNAFNNFQGQRTNIYNTLASIAGIGQTSQQQANQAASSYGTAAGNIATNLANTQTGLITGAGAAQAAGQVGAANAYGNAASNIGNTLAFNQMMRTPSASYNQSSYNSAPVNNASSSYWGR
jgi:hypothetical protein